MNNITVLELISGSDVCQKLCECGAVVSGSGGLIVGCDFGRDIADLGVTDFGRETLCKV